MAVPAPPPAPTGPAPVIKLSTESPAAEPDSAPNALPPAVLPPLATPPSASIAPVSVAGPALTHPVRPVSRLRIGLLGVAAFGVAALAGTLVFRSTWKPVPAKVYSVDAGSAATGPGPVPTVPTVPAGIQVTALPSNTLTAVPPVVTPESSTVRWAVRSQPTGATVLSESGERLGQTPLVHTTARSIGTQTIILRLPGYRDAQLSLSLGSDEEREAELVPSARLLPGLKGGKYFKRGGKQRPGQGKRTADDTTILLDFKTKKVLKTQ